MADACARLCVAAAACVRACRLYGLRRKCASERKARWIYTHARAALFVRVRACVRGGGRLQIRSQAVSARRSLARLVAHLR